MLAVSAKFLQAIKTKQPQDIRLEFSGGEVITGADIAITSGGLTYTEVLNSATDVEFGRAVMSELSAVFINADGRFTDFDFSRELTAKVGVKVETAFEFVNLGVFKGEKPDKVRGKLIEFTAHDRMSLFDKPAESFVSGLTFPCTLGEIFTKLCAFCGVGYVSAAFPNSGKTFDKNPLNDTDYTCRGILAYIAETAGSYARMSRDGAVELVWFTNADYTVTRTDRFEMTESEFLTPPIDRLEVYNSYGDQLNTSGTGEVVYGISDNPFLYIENDTQLAGLQPYVDVIYNRITSLPAYHPSSFRAEYNPAVQCGDVISVVDDYGETIAFPVFVQTITWNGGGKTVYENTGGVIRQNAPFTQRELEQLKKKSVKTKDLWTYIDSYMNSEEGVASINAAVGGKFVTEDQISGFITETELNAGVEAYINGAEGIAKLTDSLSGVFVTTGEYNKSVRITASSQVFVKAAGASSYTPSSITLTAETKGTGLTFQWYLNDTAISGATGTTLTITSGSFSGSSAAYKIVATDSAGNTFTDIISIAKLADGKDGVNGTNGKDGVNGTNGKDGVNGVDGKSLRQITTHVRSQTLATVQSWVGLQNDTWSSITIGDFNVGDTCLIAINVTDMGGVTGYMRCEILGYNASTKVLTTNNLDFMIGATGPQGSMGPQGNAGTDGYTVLLSNEFIEVPVNASRKPLTSTSYTCTVTVYKGLTALTATTGTPTASQFQVTVNSSPAGVTVTRTSANTLTLSVSTSTAISDSGYAVLAITTGGLTMSKRIVVLANMNEQVVTVDTRIEQKISENSASILQTVSGTYATKESLGSYSTTTQMNSAIEQKVNALGASLSLSVTNGEKSSVIKLTKNGVSISSQTIQFTGGVVFKNDLSTAGNTTINGANITTGTISADRIDTSTLRAQQVYYYDSSVGNYFSVMSSAISGQSTVTRVGPKDIRNNYLQALELYGSAIYLVRSGYDASDSRSLMFDVGNREIVPASDDDWYIGTENNSFNRIYLNTGVYLYDDDAAEWTRLYIYNGSLVWRDAAGDRHTII